MKEIKAELLLLYQERVMAPMGDRAKRGLDALGKNPVVVRASVVSQKSLDI